MVLIDILSVINENTNTIIYNPLGEVLSVYDGKNSIETNLNNYEVLEIGINKEKGFLYIVINASF